MFDVIIPTYNSNPEFLRKALDSVLSQTYQNFEIYICDGTPTNLPNRAQETLKDYSDSRIHIIKQSGIGPSNARNEALKEGKNPYVALLDGDDLWEKNKLEYLVSFIQKNSPKMIWAALKMGSSETDTEMFRTGFFEKLNKTAFEHRWFRVYWSPLATSSIVFEREALESINGWDETKFMGEDTDLNVRMLQNFGLYSYQINAYMGLYRKHENQTHINTAHYHENMNAGLKWADRTKLFDETFSDLKKNSKHIYDENYWNNLYVAVQSQRISSHNPDETDFENYVMLRVDGIPNGTKFTEKTPDLKNIGGLKNV